MPIDIGRRSAHHQLVISEPLVLDRLAFSAELERAAASERQRIAEGLHDDTVQVLAALVVRLEIHDSAVTAPVAGTSGSTSTVAAVADELRKVVDRLRTLSFELHPAGLSTFGLGPALRQLAESSQQFDDLDVDVIDHRQDEQPAVVVGAAYAIAKEAMLNAAKHARAEHLVITLTSNHSGLFVSIEDDGQGLDEAHAAQSPPHHLGMTTMRRRAERHGGHLTVSVNAIGGTTVELWLPST